MIFEGLLLYFIIFVFLSFMWEVGWRCGSGLGAGGSGCKFWHHLESAAWPREPCGVLIVVIINDHNLYWWSSTTIYLYWWSSAIIIYNDNHQLEVDPRNHSAKCRPLPSPCHALQLIGLSCKKFCWWRWWTKFKRRATFFAWNLPLGITRQKLTNK